MLETNYLTSLDKRGQNDHVVQVGRLRSGMRTKSALTLMVLGFGAHLAPQSIPVDFYSDIRPILSTNCVACHQGKSAPAQLHLDSPEGLLQGGTSGKVVVPGNADKSLLVERIEDKGTNRMPPGGQLSAAQIGLIKLWINQGAKAEASIDFAAQVQPIFQASCYSCHSGNDPKSVASR